MMKMINYRSKNFINTVQTYIYMCYIFLYVIIQKTLIKFWFEYSHFASSKIFKKSILNRKSLINFSSLTWKRVKCLIILYTNREFFYLSLIYKDPFIKYKIFLFFCTQSFLLLLLLFVYFND